jgi:probable rRNA maturation factor
MSKKGRIHYFTEDTKYILKSKRIISSWIRNSIKMENKDTGDINFIFCSDAYLLNLNIEYLNHNTLTDIITFDSTETENEISGDIYISIDRVKENAQNLNSLLIDELHRVIIHGILHLCGYMDKEEDEIKIMRQKEDFYLSRLSMFHVKHRN